MRFLFIINLYLIYVVRINGRFDKESRDRRML